MFLFILLEIKSLFLMHFSFVLFVYRKGRQGKTDKGKDAAGKGTAGAGKCKRKAPAEEVNLTKEQKDHYVDWLRENDSIWRRGHKL